MKYKLDLDDELFDFEGWAFVHFHTATPGYILADTLNRLYDLRLQRIDDMMLDDNPWPLFRHEDTVRHLIYFLTEHHVPPPASALPWGPGDKLLVIKGDNADPEARFIQTDFSQPPTDDDGDLLAREHAQLLDRLLATFTVASRLDFDTPPSNRRAAKERTALQQLLNTMLTYIEQQHLDLSHDEQLHL